MLTGKSAINALESSQSTQAEDRELIRQLQSPNAARLWQTNPGIFERGGVRAELPPGWEQRVDGKSGRVFYINHNQRTTCWTDPRIKVEQDEASEQALDAEDVDEDNAEAEGMLPKQGLHDSPATVSDAERNATPIHSDAVTDPSFGGGGSSSADGNADGNGSKALPPVTIRLAIPPMDIALANQKTAEMAQGKPKSSL